MDGKMVIGMNKHRELVTLQLTGSMLLHKDQVYLGSNTWGQTPGVKHLGSNTWGQTPDAYRVLFKGPSSIQFV